MAGPIVATILVRFSDSASIQYKIRLIQDTAHSRMAVPDQWKLAKSIGLCADVRSLGRRV